MKTLKRSPRFIVALFFFFALLFAAYGRTAAFGASGLATPLVNGEFVGHVGTLVDFGLSTDGQNVIAYLCDGTNVQQTLAEWFKGPVSNNGIDITNAHGLHLVASLTPQAAAVTITLTDGSSLSFSAPSIPDPGSEFGLYRSQQTVKGVQYVGGWIDIPPQPASADAGHQTFLISALLPFPVCCIPNGFIRGAIINEQTGALLPSPSFAAFSDPMSLEVPNLGTFTLHLCRQAQC